MADETTTIAASSSSPSAPPEADAPAPEVAGAETNAREPSAALEANLNGGNDGPEDAVCGAGADESRPPPAGDAAAGAAAVGSAAPEVAGGEAAAGAVAAVAAAAPPREPQPPQQPQPQQPQQPALSRDLSDYFSHLLSAVRRQRGARGGNPAPGGGGGGPSVVVLLWDGADLVVAAAKGAGGRHFLGPEGRGGGVCDGDGGGARAPAMTPDQAALYLYAAAQNIVALEAAVLGSRSPPAPMYAAAAGGGGMAGAMDRGAGAGGIAAKQVVEIVSAVSIAATFCNSRSLIVQSGILNSLAHLIESTGTIASPPSAYLKSNNGKRAGSSPGVLYALTPFHPEFLQCCLLGGHYRYAKSMLASRPASHTSLDFPYLHLQATQYLRTHYYAGLVHIGCEDWNTALDSFHLCLTVPCSAVSAISVAARKKSLLVQCLLLESEELDGNGGRAPPAKSNSQARIGGSAGKSSTKSALENKVLELPGAASAALNKYMATSSNRVGGGSGSSSAGSVSAPERTAGSETSEQSGRERQSSRRRMRSANSSSDAGGGERGAAASEGSSRSKNYSRLGSYHDLVSKYISGNARNFAKLLTEMTELLRVDGNWGLAKRLEGRLAYRAVRQVASVYSVVGVGVLEKKMQEEANIDSPVAAVEGGAVGRHGVEDLLMGMAACDARDALLDDPFLVRMDHSTGTVSFIDRDDDEESSDEEDSQDKLMEADLSHRLESCISLAERVRDLDISLTTSPKYQQYALKQMMMKGDSRVSGMMQQQQSGSSVADIGQGPMDIGVDW